MKNLRTIAVILMALSCTLASCSNNTRANDEGKAKYIFLFIGDGMGNSHVAATESYLSYKAGKLGGEQLGFTQFPYFGTATSHSASHQITDSAASGTAISTGVKTTNSYLGVDPDGNPVTSMSVDLKEDGYKVGIISSVPINHATPGAFYAHNKKRSDYYEITKWIPESGFEYFASSGMMQYFGKNKDQESSADWLEKNGYDVCFGQEEFEKADKDSKVVLIQPYNKDKEPKNYDAGTVKPEGDISLAQMVSNCIEFLGDNKPFFIMCEGGDIDWAAHSNNTMPMVMNTIAFDQAIMVAYEFYKNHPDETLIVVTADHETGGCALGTGSKTIDWELLEKTWEDNKRTSLGKEENAELNKKAGIGWTTGGHTGGPVPVYAVGKGSERFSARMDNTDIKGKILAE